jgi:hypothetical protein
MTEGEDVERVGATRDPRKAYRAGETPPELANILIPALDRLIHDLSVAIADEWTS